MGGCVPLQERLWSHQREGFPQQPPEEVTEHAGCHGESTSVPLPTEVGVQQLHGEEGEMLGKHERCGCAWPSPAEEQMPRTSPKSGIHFSLGRSTGAWGCLPRTV